MLKDKNGNFTPRKGKPSGTGHDKEGLKEVDESRLEEQNMIEDKYLDGPDQPAINAHERHVNRNLDKPDINKPSYS